MKWLLIKLIHIYRYLLSPWVGNQCRFYPTCSDYAEQAINQYGPMKGGYLMLRRLIKCQPWHKGGIDNIPPLKTSSDSQVTKSSHD